MTIRTRGLWRALSPIGVCVSAAACWGQQAPPQHPSTTLTSQPPVQFEVASVKPTGGREIGGFHVYGEGRIGFRGCTLEQLIEQAFDMQTFQIAGGPPWMKSDRFDIDARPAEGSAASKYNPPYSKAPMNDDQRRMLQALLVDRFQLKFHRETREGSVYLLTRGSKPLKLVDSKDKNEYPWAGGIGGGMVRGDGLQGINEPMSDLAWRVSYYLGRRVLDRTGITGSFDFQVAYNSGDARPDVIASILASVQELGLKLETSKGPVETITIESAEKPSAN